MGIMEIRISAIFYSSTLRTMKFCLRKRMPWMKTVLRMVNLYCIVRSFERINEIKILVY